MVHESSTDIADLVDAELVPPLVALLAGAIRSYSPTTLDIVQIEGWFGAKWLGFRGKALGVLGVRDRQALTVQAFNPKRVISAQTFERGSAGEPWTPVRSAPQLHLEIPSVANTTRRLWKLRPPGTLLVWYGVTPQEKASLMVYSLEGDGPLSWHVEADLRGEPAIIGGAGITMPEVATLCRLASTPNGESR
jgi:hypothetical protein